MNSEQLRELAAVEEAMAKWLHTFSLENPLVQSAYDAGLVCANRAVALRALADSGLPESEG
jgi:hypothetical protein